MDRRHRTAGLVLAILNRETDEWAASRPPVEYEPVTEAELETDALLWRTFSPHFD